MKQYEPRQWNMPVIWKRLNEKRRKKLYGSAFFSAKAVKLDFMLWDDYDSEPNLLNISIFYQVDLERLCALYKEWRDNLATNVAKGDNVISDKPNYGNDYQPIEGETYFQQEGDKE